MRDDQRLRGPSSERSLRLPIHCYPCWLDGEEPSDSRGVAAVDSQRAAQKYACDCVTEEGDHRVGDDFDWVVHVRRPDGVVETWTVGVEVAAQTKRVRKLTAEEAAKLPGVGG